MSDERTKILQMLSDGKISAEEAAELLEASAPSTGQNEIASVYNDALSRNVTPTNINHEWNSDTNKQTKSTYSGIRGRWTNLANNLDGMLCDGANLDRAFFFANNIDSADFRDADAESAKFFATNLDSAIFEGANLHGARILCSNLDGANFRNANLEGVLIFASNFDSANMEGADLRGQSFIATNMDGFNVPTGSTIHIDTSESIVPQGPVSRL